MTASSDQQASAVEAIIFDIDGVLTSGSIVYGPDGEWKIFNVQDGHGFKLAKRAGLKLGILSGRASEASTRRAQELQVDVCEQGIKDKGALLPDILGKLGVDAAKTCYVGDDVVDLPCMQIVGFPVAVENAVEEVKACALYTTVRRGGDGAAREVIELILKAKGLWSEVMNRYEG